jgi:hypothetical protein
MRSPPLNRLRVQHVVMAAQKSVTQLLPVAAHKGAAIEEGVDGAVERKQTMLQPQPSGQGRQRARTKVALLFQCPGARLADQVPKRSGRAVANRGSCLARSQVGQQAPQRRNIEANNSL